MNRKLFTILTALMWISLPLTALRYWQVWDQLPARMATHFAANRQANGWMSRDVSLYYALVVTAVTLVVFTGIALLVLRLKAELDTSSFALLAFFCLIQGFVFYVNNGILDYSLAGRPVTVSPVLIGVPIAIVLFVCFFMRAPRGARLPEGQTLAEETDGSLVPFAVAGSGAPAGVRVGMGLLGLLFLLIGCHAWEGFLYRFSATGLEISTLGLRLRSIPQSPMARYRIERGMALRGYGIRGVGNTRAYVWGHDVVHITTLEGEVFLGHNDAARIGPDLDMMKQHAHS